jgi:hypothetical protein
VMDLVQSTYVTSLVLEALDQLKGSTTTISALGHWSLRAHARGLPDCHQQCQADFGMGVVTTAHRRLALAVVVVVR